MIESFLLCCQYQNTSSNFEHENIAKLDCFLLFRRFFKTRGCERCYIFMKGVPVLQTLYVLKRLAANSRWRLCRIVLYIYAIVKRTTQFVVETKKAQGLYYQNEQLYKLHADVDYR